MRRLVLAAVTACVFGASAMAVEALEDDGLAPCGLELSTSAPAGGSGLMLAQYTLPSAEERQAACRRGCDDRAQASTNSGTQSGVAIANELQRCKQGCNSIR